MKCLYPCLKCNEEKLEYDDFKSIDCVTNEWYYNTTVNTTDLYCIFVQNDVWDWDVAFYDIYGCRDDCDDIPCSNKNFCSGRGTCSFFTMMHVIVVLVIPATYVKRSFLSAILNSGISIVKHVVKISVCVDK